MATATVSVTGLTEIRHVLRKIGDKDLQAQLKATNKAAAEMVVQAALPNVPVRSGRLRESVRALGSQSSGRAVAGGRVRYAPPVHWGRKKGNVGRPPGNHPGPNVVKSRPFLFDAAQACRARIAEQYAKDIDRVMDAVRRHIAK